MKGLIFKCVVAIFLAAGIANYLIYLNTGNMPVVDWKNKFSHMDIAGQLKSFSPKNVLSDAKQSIKKLMPTSMSSTNDAPIKIYKWKDNKGVIHYENRPVDGAQEMLVDVNSNILKQESGGIDAKPADNSDEHVNEENIDEQPAIEKTRAASELMKAHTQAVEQAH